MTFQTYAKLMQRLSAPDRLIILGNHHDSWNFGAADATSGTSVMLEIARALGEKKKDGWRPRRTIILCSWDAEEYGLMGSTEWTEEFGKIIAERAVAYLNMDIAVAEHCHVSPNG